MKKFFAGVCAVLIVIAIMVALPSSVAFNNWYNRVIRQVDDATNYETLKKVEDTCRSMIANYEADRLTYEQYKDSDKSSEQGYASAAKLRANKTATQYNNYILKNSYVWRDNVPADIRMELEIIE